MDTESSDYNQAVSNLGSMHPDKFLIKQFSLHSENKVGRLNDLFNIMNQNEVFIMAITTIDSTDTSIIRIVVNYPQRTRKLLKENNFYFSESNVVAVELSDCTEMHKITRALIQAEININYLYPFLSRPNDKSAITLSLEEHDLAIEIMLKSNLTLLTQDDIAR